MLTMHPQNGLEKALCDRAFQEEIPLSGTFELLPVCNMNCKMCYVRISYEEMERQGKMLTAQQWLEIGRQAAEMGTMFLLLTGGEPLLYPDFSEVYRGLRNLGIFITVNTNGTMITEKVVDLFLEDMPRRINISLYGTNDEVYRRLCQNPKGFTEVMNGIYLLKEAGIPVKLNYTLTPQNQSELDEIMRISDSLQIPISTPTYMFPPARKQGHTSTASFDRLSPRDTAKKQLEILYKHFHETPDYAERLKRQLEEIKPENHTAPPIDPPGGFLCSAGVSSFWVNWKGNMTSCGMLETPYKNLLKDDFRHSWEYIKNETKKIFTSSKCFNCRYRKHCQTCAASAYAETGDFKKEVPYHCELCKEYESELKKHLKELENPDRPIMYKNGEK